MSELLVRAALEKRLAALTPAWPTKWPNTSLKPTGDHFQSAAILWATTRPSGPGPQAASVFSGIFQVTAFVAANTGVDVVDARALALCAQFKRGLRLTEGGVIVRLLEPSRGPGLEDPGWYGVPTSIPFFTYINR